ncbi:MAG TPA: SpoIID/LytB domain-containing protein [Oscillatoriaceae cyanobacterium]
MIARRACFFGLLAAAWLSGAAPAHAATQVRVGLVDRASSVLFSASTPAALLDERGHTLLTIAALESWSARADGNGVIATGPGGRMVTVAGELFVAPLAKSGIPLVFARTRWYRGELELRPDGGITAIDVLPLEQYLYGVVPSEMPASWDQQALEAQAVAARSYALANLGKHGSLGYDLCPTDDCQVYGGAAAETVATDQAVDATRAQVLTFGGRVVPAYFCASSGGYTENSEDVWERAIPCLRAVPDYDQKSPYFTWYKDVTVGDLAAGLARFGVDVGTLMQVQPVDRSYSGRVKDIRIVGSNGSCVVRGETFRMAARLDSTLFNVSPVGDGTPSEFAFAGRGLGHGVGLSQWGAKALAEMGYNYTQILGHYYPGAQLSRE